MAISSMTEHSPDVSLATTSPLQALLSIDSQISQEIPTDSSLRQINFMSYELATLCLNKSDEEVYEALNYFFFTTKNFRVHPAHFLLHEILEERKGCGIALALLYMHLAGSLGLKLELIHRPLHTILKWSREGRSSFIDLEACGRLLTEDQLLLIVNKHKDQVQCLSMSEALVQYLSYISMNCRNRQDKTSLHKTLDMILRLEPENTRFLAERALLRKELGMLREALCDLKRYFSFTEMSVASQELISAYEELKN